MCLPSLPLFVLLFCVHPVQNFRDNQVPGNAAEGLAQCWPPGLVAPVVTVAHRVHALGNHIAMFAALEWCR